MTTEEILKRLKKESIQNKDNFFAKFLQDIADDNTKMLKLGLTQEECDKLDDLMKDVHKESDSISRKLVLIYRAIAKETPALFNGVVVSTFPVSGNGEYIIVIQRILGDY